MTDIVQELRGAAKNMGGAAGQVFTDAADEIARLREALDGIAPWLSASLSPKGIGGLGCDAGPEYRAACDAVFAALGEGEG